MAKATEPCRAVCLDAPAQDVTLRGAQPQRSCMTATVQPTANMGMGT